MTLSSHIVDSHISDFESRMKDIVKLDPPTTIVIADHSTLSEVSMGTLLVRVTDAQYFTHDMLLPAMNIPGLDRYLFLGGTVSLKGVNMIIAKQSYLDVGQVQVPIRKDTDCPPIDYLGLKLAHPPNGSSAPDEGYLGALTTDGVDYGLPSYQEQSLGDGCLSHNRGTAIHRDIYGGARSLSATDYQYNFSSWRSPN